MLALSCRHEETDTRLNFHAQHAALSGYEQIIIESPDTDVAVLAIAHSSLLNSRLLFLTGTNERRRYIDIRKLAANLGESLCKALVGFHALTGCDSTSAFVGKGKAAPFKLLRSDEVFVQALIMLGREYDLTHEVFDACERFVCSLYGHKRVDVNAVRYAMFCSKATESSLLPPTQEALMQHVPCANYQAAVWR